MKNTTFFLGSLSICATTMNVVAQESVLANAYKKHYGEVKKTELPSDAPNILLITSDQQHWMAIGYNDPKCKTPNLDRLASMGVRFDRAYTCNPVSTPTRASIITGMYPSQHGAYALGTKLPEDVHCVGEDFSAHGYKTALVGKAHFQPLAGTAKYPSAEAYPILQDLEFWEKFTGPFYGFEHVELTRNHGDEAHVGQHYGIWLQSQTGNKWKDWFLTPTGTVTQKQHGAWAIPEKYHMNAWIAERSNALLDEYNKKGERFFLWASFFDPHPPYLVPEPWASMYDPEDMDLPATFNDDLSDMPSHYLATQTLKADRSRWQEGNPSYAVHGLGYQKRDPKVTRENQAIYYGMVTMMDHYIGLILDKLEQTGQIKNTLIIFTSDHGNMIGHHGLSAKGICDYEDAVKIPFIVACQGKIHPGTRSEALLSVVDIAPSILSMCGIDIPSSMTGMDQSPVWTGKKEEVRDFVIVENRFQMTKFYIKTYIDKHYKLAYDMNSDEGELFDLEKDPNETTNQWNNPEYKDIKLKLLLRALQSEMKSEPVPMPRIAIA